MTYQTIEVKPLAGNIGAEIFGVDLSGDIPGETFAEIRRAWNENVVIFFRDQELDFERQKAFARRFGPLMVDPIIASPEGQPELMVVSKYENEKFTFGEGWHSDSTYREKPPMGSFLYCVEAPPQGGDTMFGNQYLAYETLSEGLKEQLGQLTAIHNNIRYAASLVPRFPADRSMKLRTDGAVEEAMKAEVEHPVVRTHPETGRKALFVSRGYVNRFKGWTEEESRPLLNFLCAHSERPEFTCRFRWKAGSMALWDNRCAQHKPIGDSNGYRRIMHRVVVEGDRPV